MESGEGLKRKFTPQYVQMKNEAGKHVPVTLRALTIADYLASKHWTNDIDEGMPSNELVLPQNNADETTWSR